MSSRREPERTTLEGVAIVAAHRLAQDPSGSPRWWVTLSDGTSAETGPGAPAAWVISDTAMHGVPLTAVLLDGYLWTVRR